MRADGATPERVLVPPDPDPRANTWVLRLGTRLCCGSDGIETSHRFRNCGRSHYRATESRSSICLVFRMLGNGSALAKRSLARLREPMTAEWIR